MATKKNVISSTEILIQTLTNMIEGSENGSKYSTNAFEELLSMAEDVKAEKYEEAFDEGRQQGLEQATEAIKNLI